MQTPLQFSHELIKGKIAEMIFEQLLRDAGGFTILDFGYEKVVPELARMHKDKEARKTLDVVRRAPDFAIINHDTGKVHLIEVKYRSSPSEADNLRIAKRMAESWNPSYLFLATPEGFFFNSVEKILEQGGCMDSLNHKNITPELQENYLAMLNEFIVHSEK